MNRTNIPAGDYVSEGLSVVMPDSCFPNMIVGDKANHPWPYLRREVSHNWYCDRRAPEVGFLNRDEAILLYNLALPFRGKPALEIGSWMGWSTCHLALAGLGLDVMDPVMENPEQVKSVRESLAAAGVLSNVRLYALASPDGIREITRVTSTKWSFFFIDGDHETPAPERDARECLEHADKDAMMVFHDLASPDVEAGLHFLWSQGWQVLVYQTMQIMGVAWRGDVKPVSHKPDPTIAWSLPLHLAKYPVSGSSLEEETRRLSQGIALRDQEIASRDKKVAELEARLTSVVAQAEQTRFELGARDAQLNSVQAELKARHDRLSVLENRAGAQEDELAASRDRLAHVEDQVQRQQSELAYLRGLLTAQEAELVSRKEEIRHLENDKARCSWELDRRSTEFQRLQLTLGALQGSVSWKITRPLRAIKHGVRFVRHAPGRLSSSVRREMESLAPKTPSRLQVIRATSVVVPRLSRRALRAARRLFTQQYDLSHKAALITGSGLFDATFYCQRNPDVAQAGVDPLVHYLTNGAAEGRDPHPLFDTSFYLESNPDVAQAGVNPLVHYLTNGAAEGRDPHPLFDTSFYLESNPDVAQAGVNPLVHYLSNGAAEGRDPHPLFDTSFYLEQKPHLKGLGINPLVHFITEGPTSEFDPFSPTPRLAETGICIVTPDIVGPVKNGGIGTACYHFARVLAEAGRPVSVFFTGDVTDGQKAHWRNAYAKMRINFIALSDAPPVTRFVFGSTWFLERSWRVFDYLRKTNFSAIHFQDWQANGFWSIKAKQTGIAFGGTTLTVMMHSCTKWIDEGMQQFSPNPFETAKLIWVETYCVSHCDLLLSPSHYMLQWVRGKLVHSTQPARITPYSWAGEAVTAPRASIAVDNDHLIFFGRLETRKGLHILGQALRQLAQDGVGLPRAVSFLGKHASVLGRDSAEYLEELRRDLPTVAMNIINDFDYSRALDYIRQTRGLVVIPSIVDNYPLTVLECIQTGIPFIAAATGGIPEMIDARVSFEPHTASLEERLRHRHTIEHSGLEHKYSASLAASVWRDLHADIEAASQARTVASARETARAMSVSVCVPFFNHHRYLETLVTGLACQSYPVFEVILVNDGSSAEASRQFERMATRNRDRRFRFLVTENGGPGAARNFAAEQASGELLLFFDADNLPKGKDFIAALVRALQCSNADCVTCPYDVVNADRILVFERDVLSTYRPIGGCTEAGFFENTFGDATMVIKRSVFDKLGGFPTQRASWEDHEFLLNLCFKGYKLETLPEALFYYRQSAVSRHRQANDFCNYQSLFGQLQVAPSAELARIVAAISGPMLAGRPGSPAANLIAR
jgi:GT2 family glycosyltransferase/glycosyltransferase involved in cell wall biosynthesis